MKKFSPCIQLFLEKNETVKQEQVNTIPVIELETNCQRVLEKNSAYKILRVTSSNPKVNAEKVLMHDYFQVNTFENILSKLIYTKHPTIKAPIGYLKPEEGADATIFYNIEEKGSLQALLDYYDKKNLGLSNNFTWYFSSPNSDNSLEIPNSDVNNSEKITIQDLSLTLEQKAKILIGIASALLYMQQVGLQTSYILPSSVLLNDNFEPILINTELPPYTTSPETDALFIANDSQDKLQSDDLVFSFGVLAYWLLAERRPFYYTTLQNAVEKLRYGQVPLFPGSLPQTLSSLLTKCCSTNSHKRPSLSIVLCTLYDSFRTPNIISYSNSILPPTLIAAIRLANLGPQSKIMKLLMSTTPALAGQNLFKASGMAEEYPVCDRFLAYHLMFCSANYKYTDARRKLFVMLINNYLGEEDKSKSSNAAFNLVSKWSEEDPESKVLLAKCYEYGIGCTEDQKKAYETISEIQNLFSASYQKGLYLEKGIGTEKSGSSALTIQKDAIRDSPDEQTIDSYYQILSYPPFRDVKELLNIIHNAGQIKKCATLNYRLLDLYMTTNQGDDQHVSSLLKQLVSEEITNENMNIASNILKLMYERKKGKNYKPTDVYNIDQDLYEKICKKQLPTHEINRKEASHNIVTKIIETQNLPQTALKDIELNSANDKKQRAHCLLAKEDRDIVEAENLLMELEAEGDKGAKAELILLRLSLGIADEDEALSSLKDLMNSSVPEAFNAFAYYAMKYNYGYLSDVRINLLKAVDCGYMPAFYNLAQYDSTILTTSLYDVEQIKILQKSFYEKASPAIFGVFDML